MHLAKVREELEAMRARLEEQERDKNLEASNEELRRQLAKAREGALAMEKENQALKSEIHGLKQRCSLLLDEKKFLDRSARVSKRDSIVL